MAISSLGVGSGLDIESLVSQLVAAEGAAPLQRLDRQEILLQARLSAFGSVKGALATFQSKLQTASNLESYRSKSVGISDSSIFGATATSSAAVGSHTVDVLQLAQAHRVASAGFAGLDTTLSSGTLTIEFGTDTGGVFTANPDKTTQTLTIDTTNNTVAGVRDAINAAGMGVTASVVFNGTDYQLTLTSDDTGEANSLRISGIAELTYDPADIPGSAMTTTMTAQDASALVDGIAITSDSNTIKDAIEGVSINLKKADLGNAVSLTISEDINKAMDAVKAFVDGYNELMSTINSVSGYDEDTETAGPLLGDATIRSIVMQVQRIISTPVDGLDGKYRFTGDIGLATQNDGTLKMDEAKLREALTDNAYDVGRIFAEGASVSDSLMRYVGASSETERGVYDVFINSITPAQAEIPATAGVYTGNWTTFLDDTAGPFSATIGNNENDFTITVDGVTSGALTIPNKDYGALGLTGADLASDIQAVIDADAALIAAGVGVTVSYESNGVDSGRLVFTSNSTGSTSDVTFFSSDGQFGNNLGIDETILNNVVGTDLIPAVAQIIDATIGGYAATQDGDYLIGAVGTPVEGLKIEYLGGGTGSRGTVSFTRGMASVMDNMLTSLLDKDGVFSARTEIYNDSIEDIEARRETVNQRLAQVEKRYYTQFIALDTMIAQLQSTGDYLAQQLASLPGARKAPTGGAA